ncbi:MULTISPECIES: hypothetical protein [Moorena]|nr:MULTISPECIES: hypothetical protein [Moorena]
METRTLAHGSPHLPISPNSPLIPDSRFCSRFPIPDSRFPIPFFN